MAHYIVNGEKMVQVHEAICRHHGLALGTLEEGCVDINMITAFCTADWPEGEEHQRWLDTASPQEIADWIIAAGPEAYGLIKK